MHFTYFCEKRGGGSELRFSVLLRPGLFVFSVMTSISSVDTPVDRRRFVFSSVFVTYSASCRTTTPSSWLSSFTSSIWIYICIFRCTFRLSIDVSASLIFFVLITVPVISFLL